MTARPVSPGEPTDPTPPTEESLRDTHLRGEPLVIDLDGIVMRWASQWNESDDGEVRAWRDDVAALIDEIYRLRQVSNAYFEEMVRRTPSPAPREPDREPVTAAPATLIDRLTELDRTMTPGPWRHVYNSVVMGNSSRVDDDRKHQLAQYVTAPDADGIAHLRNLLPEIIGAIDRLQIALRVATHTPHDQAGEPIEGFPVCSVCGAIQIAEDDILAIEAEATAATPAALPEGRETVLRGALARLVEVTDKGNAVAPGEQHPFFVAHSHEYDEMWLAAWAAARAALSATPEVPLDPEPVLCEAMQDSGRVCTLRDGHAGDHRDGPHRWNYYRPRLALSAPDRHGPDPAKERCRACGEPWPCPLVVADGMRTPGTDRTECICGTDAAIAAGKTGYARMDILCPKHDGPDR